MSDTHFLGGVWESPSSLPPARPGVYWVVSVVSNKAAAYNDVLVVGLRLQLECIRGLQVGQALCLWGER